MELVKGPELSAAVLPYCRWDFCWVKVCVICPFSTTGTAVHIAGRGLRFKQGNCSHEWRQSGVQAPGVAPANVLLFHFKRDSWGWSSGEQVLGRAVCLVPGSRSPHCPWAQKVVSFLQQISVSLYFCYLILLPKLVFQILGLVMPHCVTAKTITLYVNMNTHCQPNCHAELLNRAHVSWDYHERLLSSEF